MNTPNKKGFLLGGGGGSRKLMNEDAEVDILIWLNTCWRNSIVISCNKIIAYRIELNGGDFKLTYNAYKFWVHHFLIRHKLSIRKACHIGQWLSKDYENIIYKLFLLEHIKKKETKNSDRNSSTCI